MIRALALRVLLVALLLGAYFYVWRPYGRTTAVRAVAVPALQAAHSGPSDRWEIRVAPDAHRLTLRSSSGSYSIGWTAPAGVRFLLPALGVVLLAPRRLYWLVLWGGHIIVGVLGISCLCFGMAGSEAWFVLYDGLTQYLVDAFSLGVATWAAVVEFDLDDPFSPEEA